MLSHHIQQSSEVEPESGYHKKYYVIPLHSKELGGRTRDWISQKVLRYPTIFSRARRYNQRVNITKRYELRDRTREWTSRGGLQTFNTLAATTLSQSSEIEPESGYHERYELRDRTREWTSRGGLQTFNTLAATTLSQSSEIEPESGYYKRYVSSEIKPESGRPQVDYRL